jgi:hypothetical protein
VETLAGPISPELVLVDPELRPLALRQLGSHAAVHPRLASRGWSRAKGAEPATRPAGDAGTRGVEADRLEPRPAQAPAVVRAARWWLAVLVRSAAIVGMVLGASVVFRLFL